MVGDSSLPVRFSVQVLNLPVLREVQVSSAPAPKSARASWNPRPLSDEAPTLAAFKDPGLKSPSGSELPSFGQFSTHSAHRPNRALTKSLQISVTETAVSAMPSSSRDLWVLHERVRVAPKDHVNWRA